METTPRHTVPGVVLFEEHRFLKAHVRNVEPTVPRREYRRQGGGGGGDAERRPQVAEQLQQALSRLD